MIITHFVSKFLDSLYGPLARFYDTVSWSVSFGHWKEWVLSTIPYIHGNTILELGFGPGHLLEYLRLNGYRTFGIDSSRQMAKITLDRLRKNASPAGERNNQAIIRGFAGQLPFSSHSFDTIISTFPTDYIFQPSVLDETRRVLKQDGKLIVLLAAFPRRDTLPSAFLLLLYRITGGTASDRNQMETSICVSLQNIGFTPSFEWIQGKYSDLLLIKV